MSEAKVPDFWCIDQIPDSVIDIRLGDAHPRKAKGFGFSATRARQGRLTLQLRGKLNWYAAVADCALGHIPLTKSLLERANDADGQDKFSGDRDLNSHSVSYIGRRVNACEPSVLRWRAARCSSSTLLGLQGSVGPPIRLAASSADGYSNGGAAFVREQADEDFALDELAALANLSAKHFARAFRQSTGVPPHRWLIERRIDRAKALLVEADLGIAEIALARGFADQSHFRAAFHKSVGATPDACRRETRR